MTAYTLTLPLPIPRPKRGAVLAGKAGSVLGSGSGSGPIKTNFPTGFQRT